MPTFPLAQFDVAITANPAGGVGAEFLVNVENPGTAAEFALTFSRFLADAYAAGVVQLGIGVEMDFGAGLEEIDVGDRGVTFSIGEHLDGFTDDCSFSFPAEHHSPFETDLLRSRRRVRITGYMGEPGKIASRVLFDGFTSDGEWSTPPPVATVRLLDRAAEHSEKRVALVVDPGSLRTRGSIVREVLADLGIPWSVMDLPNDGGRKAKSISEGGTTRVFEWINQFLSPLGVKCAYIDGALEIKRFVPAATPVRTLTAADIRGAITVTPPRVDAPNIITATGSTFDHDALELSASSSAPEITETRVIAEPDTFTVPQAVEEQSALGVVSPYGTTWGEIGFAVPIREIFVETRRKPGKVTQTITEWGWYAPKCAPATQQLDGSITFRFCYIYEDGSYSLHPRARYRIVRQTIVVDETTENGTTRTETVFEWYAKKRATHQVILGGAHDPDFTYLTDQGEGWVDIEEKFLETTKTTSTVTADSQGFISSEVTEVERFAARPSVKKLSAWVYGPQGAERYRAAETESKLLVERTTVTYVPLDGESFKKTTELFTTEGGNAPAVHETFTGSRPGLTLPNSKPAIGTSQIMTATFRNEVAIANAAVYDEELDEWIGGEIQGDDSYIQNEECETQDELQFVAKEHARELGKYIIGFPMPFDLTLHKGQTIALDIPDFQFNSEPLLVTDVEKEISDSARAENNQQVTAVYYPPELV